MLHQPEPPRKTKDPQNPPLLAEPSLLPLLKLLLYIIQAAAKPICRAVGLLLRLMIPRRARERVARTFTD